MNILFVVLLICLEIALVILTAAKKDGKAIWRRNRAIARAIEFGLLLGIVLLLALVAFLLTRRRRK